MTYERGREAINLSREIDQVSLKADFISLHLHHQPGALSSVPLLYTLVSVLFHQYVHNAGELWIDSVEWGGTRGWWSLFEEAEFDGGGMMMCGWALKGSAHSLTRSLV